VRQGHAEMVEGEQGEGSVAGGGGIQGSPAGLARLEGYSRKSARGFLAVLERAGIITQGRGRLTVHDPVALERYVY